MCWYQWVPYGEYMLGLARIGQRRSRGHHFMSLDAILPMKYESEVTVALEFIGLGFLT